MVIDITIHKLDLRIFNDETAMIAKRGAKAAIMIYTSMGATKTLLLDERSRRPLYAPYAT